MPIHVEDPYYHAALATKSCKVDEDPINTKAGSQREKPNPEEERSQWGGRSQDGGGIGRGDHFLFYKFIERTTER